MKIKPHATDVIQVTGHATVDGFDLHGMTLIVDAVDRDRVIAHLTNNDGNIRIDLGNVEVVYRSDHPRSAIEEDWRSL